MFSNRFRRKEASSVRAAPSRVHFALVSALLARVLAILLAACGSGNTASSATSSIPLKAGESPMGQQLYGKKRGGTLTVYDHEDFEHFDPGEAYANEDYTITSATQRSLYAY